jgi:hypothetical protein
MNARIRGSAIGLALAWVAIGGALAADVVFTITGDGRTTTFELPLNPAMLLNNVSGVVIPGFSFEIFSVPTTVNGVAKPPTVLSFYSTGLGPGGFSLTVFSVFPASNFIAARKAAPRFLPAPLAYATCLVTHLTR